MPLKLAALTMAYNETALLPIWARHYARQAGPDHCYVVDHGSTEPISVPPGVNVVRLPRSAHDDVRRARFISKLLCGLLEYYDWVIYTDVDELVLADPERYSNLQQFCAHAKHRTINAIGFDVQHVPLLEAPLNLDQPVGQQRGWVRFTSAMCKPVLTCQPLDWTAGFHGSNQEPAFSDVCLFHLHWADRDIGLNRLAKTRVMPWSDDASGCHQRIDDTAWAALFDGMARLPRSGPVQFNASHQPVSHWIQQTIDSRSHEGGVKEFSLTVNAPELWPIPSHFRARL